MNIRLNPEIFKEEARELIVDLEKQLLELEANPQHIPILDTIFRHLHTIKGSGAMYGLDLISGFAHEMETLFDLLRKEKLVADKSIIDITLQGIDHIRYLLTNPSEDEDFQFIHCQLISIFQKKANPQPSQKESPNLPQKQEAVITQKVGVKAKWVTYRILFTPEATLFHRGVNPLNILAELEELGECIIYTHPEKIGYLEYMEPTLCYLSWSIILHTQADLNRIKDVFIFVQDSPRLSFDVIDQDDVFDIQRDSKNLTDILVERGYLDLKDIQDIIRDRKAVPQIALEKGLISKDKLEASVAEKDFVEKMRKERSSQVSGTTIRVKNQRLDELLNCVGELVTLQSRLTQYVSDKKDPELLIIAKQIEKLSTELRDNSMSLRMIPIKETFDSFHRLVRDLSSRLDKEVELVLEGSETEIDKNVIEMLKDPLVHIVRNAIDHGIETRSDRLNKGKADRGLIKLTAQHAGAYVLIKCIDNGAGLNAEKIRARAVQLGWIKENQEVSDNTLYSFVFEPGFSTSNQVSDISGRGVGMDVVRTNIERIRGTVQIESEKDKGCTIILRIPLTLAIIDGLLVQVADRYFVINLALAEECVEIKEKDQRQGHTLILVRNEWIPYIPIRQLFAIPGQSPAIQQIVIANPDMGRIGVLVDRVVGQIQTVIKPLSRLYQGVKGLSGATILGNGTVALILDILELRHLMEQLERERHAKDN